MTPSPRRLRPWPRCRLLWNLQKITLSFVSMTACWSSLIVAYAPPSNTMAGAVLSRRHPSTSLPPHFTASNVNNSRIHSFLHTLLLASSSSSSVTGGDDIPFQKSKTSPVDTFDETAYETNRLAQDARAMNEMKALAQEEYAKLRTPWKWRIRKAVWDYMEERNVAQFPRWDFFLLSFVICVFSRASSCVCPVLLVVCSILGCLR